MTYSDPDKQREANKEQMRRARAKGNTKPTSNQSNTEYPHVTDKALLLSQDSIPIEQMCITDDWQPKQGMTVIDERSNEPSDVIPGPDSNKRRIFEESRPERTELKEQVNKIYQEFREAKPKRGKGIERFADLPIGIQHTIDRLSRDNVGRIDEAVKARRTKIAIHYQTTCFGYQGI